MGLSMRAVKWMLAVVAVAALAVAGLYTYHLRNQDVVSLLSCMETPPFPGSKWACSKAMYASHPTPDEVAQMNSMAGAIGLLSLPEDESRQLLKHFIAAGLDVNALDQREKTRGWTSLHSAVFEGDAKAVKLLLEAGAKVDLENARKPGPREILESQLSKRPGDAGLVEIQKMLGSPGR